MFGATITMITALQVQKYLKPYKLDSNNKLEMNEIISGTFTIFAIIIFNDDEESVPIINFIVFLAGNCQFMSNHQIIVLIVNARFLLLWLFYMLKIQKYQICKKISKLIGNILFIRSDDKNHPQITVCY